MTQYFLAPHVYFGWRGEAVVFLDLKRDDYLLVNGSAAAALRALSQGEQRDEQEFGSSEALQTLVESGLLTTDRTAGKCIVATEIDLPLDRLVDPSSQTAAHVTPGHVWNFIAACTVAATRLAWQPLDAIVEEVERRKRLRQKHLQKTADIPRARELTAIFLQLRSFFPVDYLCLYDSLALLEFLARYRIHPTWVFGIKLEPWAAHCWLQEAGLVFNDGVEEAANYTPIMAV